MTPPWYDYLDRIQPPSDKEDFNPVGFVLEASVNLRLALKTVTCDWVCRRHADIVREKTESYARLRAGRRPQSALTDAQRDLDDALWRLSSAMRRCPPARPAVPTISLVVTDGAGLQALR